LFELLLSPHPDTVAANTTAARIATRVAIIVLLPASSGAVAEPRDIAIGRGYVQIRIMQMYVAAVALW